MHTFEKTQNKIDPSDLISRQHVIPPMVKKYGVNWQLNFGKPAGRGKCNVPSLADIYEQLTRYGLDLFDTITPGDTSFVFTEIGSPAGSSQTRIKFDTATDARLRALKTRIDAGEFQLIAGEGYRRNVTGISLISVAVNLMQFAIEAIALRLYPMNTAQNPSTTPSEGARNEGHLQRQYK